MEQLQITFRKLLNGTDTTFHRYMHERINWDARMIGLMGPRGIGKTTLVLQHIKEHLPLNESLYVQAEDFYFASNRLVDLAGSFAKTGGRYLFIDEIHKYKDWSRELKLIYDYYPELHVVFTGSSVLDIAKGAFDLSRLSRISGTVPWYPLPRMYVAAAAAARGGDARRLPPPAAFL